MINPKDIKNEGRELTPHAWAFENAALLAEGIPVFLDIVTKYESTLRRLILLDDHNHDLYRTELAILEGGGLMRELKKLRD